jgi:hypothetical protein
MFKILFLRGYNSKFVKFFIPIVKPLNLILRYARNVMP